MKKLFAAVLAMLMLCPAVMAENLPETVGEIPVTSFETYSRSFAELTEEKWEPDIIELIQVLKPEDGVTISVCLEAQNVVCATVEFSCDQVTGSVRAAIENLGWLSEEAIEQVFALEDNDAQLEIEDCLVWRVHGENRDCFSICRAADGERIVWQPIHGGEKLHKKIECSGMDVSRMLTDEAAMFTNWLNCKRCNAPEETEETVEAE